MKSKIRKSIGYSIMWLAVVVMIGGMIYQMGIWTFIDIFWLPAVVLFMLFFGLFLTCDNPNEKEKE